MTTQQCLHSSRLTKNKTSLTGFVIMKYMFDQQNQYIKNCHNFTKQKLI